MSEKAKARRMAKRQAMFAQGPSSATGLGPSSGDEPDFTKSSEANHPRLHLVMNTLWREQVPQETTDAIISTAVRGLRDGYWLTFPMMVQDGTVRQGIALVAKHDHRTHSNRDVVMAPGSTHLAMLLLFNTPEMWAANAAKITRLWPEQPDLSEEVKVLSGTQVTAYTLKHEAQNSH